MLTAVGAAQFPAAPTAGHGIDHIQRVPTDNGSCHRSHAWRDHLLDRDIRHSRT